MKTRYLFGLPFATLSINSEEIECLVDTGFNGSLLLPLQKIQEMKLNPVAVAHYALVDGSQVESQIFETVIDWFGMKKRASVVGSASDFCLVGMELLRNAKIVMEAKKEILIIEKP
ncbi:hypothetical protein HYS50_00760 [Candidatus Woesearchaeota archaeon]|nr:hypothetical protein [Candidatus Woesearchaeota archaeon]